MDSLLNKLKSNFKNDDAYPLMKEIYIIYNNEAFYFTREEIKKRP